MTIYRIDGSYPRGSYSGNIITGTTSKTRKAVEEWPAAEIILDKKDGWDHFNKNCTADHFALVFGDYSKEFITFNKIMDIKNIITM